MSEAVDCGCTPHPWTVLAVTCTTSEAALAVKKELQLLQRKKVIHETTYCLTVEDPENNVGSGGATLNALLVAVEHISAKRGFNVLNPDVLLDSRILIFHNGRPSFLEVCGNGFLSLPRGGCGCLPKTNLEHLLAFVDAIAVNTAIHGVWVCSTDMLLSPMSGYRRTAFPPADCVLFGALATTSYASGHGVLKLSQKTEDDVPWDGVTDIRYCPPLNEVRKLLWKQTDKVPVVCGIVFLSSPLSEALLSLHAQTPLSSCTYLGSDTGAQPVQVSLFFDILTAMCEGISKESFLAGDCGKTYGVAHSYAHSERTHRVRELVWTKLRRFKIGTIVLEDVDYSYLSDKSTVSSHSKLLNAFRTRVCVPETRSRMSAINSLCDAGASFAEGPLSVIQHCVLKSSVGRTVSVGTNSFLSGIVLDEHSEEMILEIGDNLAIVVYRFRGDDGETRYSPVISGVNDDSRTTLTSPGSTFCNVGWHEFFGRTGIEAFDIWEESSNDNERCLFEAKLFPVNGSIEDVLWFTKSNGTHEREKYLHKWRKMDRISLREILSKCDPSEEFHHRREVSRAVTIHEIQRSLTEDVEISLDPAFRCAVVEGWADRLFDVLDELAAGCDSERWNPGKAARILGNIANLLGLLADGDGGLRSGPAANKEWTKAYHTFEKNIPGSIRDGVAALKEARSKWINVGPHRLIRAARHYEGASQILIRHAVFTSEQFASTVTGGPLPPEGVWVTCECPARIDLFGGWTDTPPICYELGGSVVNVSILVNGKCPIGAKVRRCPLPVIRLRLDEDVTLTLEDVTDFLDYDQPTAAGALAKACIVWTKTVRLDGTSSLSEQLVRRFGGSGIELHSWSNLPQGSGLGTSSIMAGAIVAALWTAAGIKYDKEALIHGVLCIEQMLTTGGGWQDQVGGLTGGFVHGRTLPGLPLRVLREKLDSSPEFVDRLERHLVLVYTGKIRLAKNLLQNVLRNWFARDDDVLNTFQNLGRKSEDFVEALKEENLSKMGGLMNEYWELKKRLAPGAEPAATALLMKALEPHSYGRLLCGAGGGGFMVLLVKNASDVSAVDDIIAAAEKSGVSKYSLKIDTRGASVRIGDVQVNLD